MNQGNVWLTKFDSWITMAWVAISGGAASAVLTYMQAGGKTDLEALKHAAIGGALVGLCGLFINSPRNKKDAPTQGASPILPVK